MKKKVPLKPSLGAPYKVDKDVLELKTSYAHDYPPLDKRKCYEGALYRKSGCRLHFPMAKRAHGNCLHFAFFWFLFFSTHLECCLKDMRGKIYRAGCPGCFKHCPVLQGKIPLIIPRPVSEYMDTVSRVGNVITVYKINDHEKCKPPNGCSHFYKMDEAP